MKLELPEISQGEKFHLIEWLNCVGLLDGLNHQEMHSKALIECVSEKQFKLHLNYEARIPLFIHESKDVSYLGVHLVDFYHLGFDQLDTDYLIELEYFGFPIARSCLLKNVRTIYPGDEFVLNTNKVIWISPTTKDVCYSPMDIESESGESGAIFNALPDAARLLFSPLDNSFYASLLSQLVTRKDTVININRNQLPESECIEKRRKKWVDSAKQSSTIKKQCIKQKLKNAYIELENQKKSISSELDLNDFSNKYFRQPYIQFQLNCLGLAIGRIINLVNANENLVVNRHKFPLQSKSIINLYEAFQRLFYYGNRWLVRKWFFIPPLVSAQLVKRYSSSTNGEINLFTYALTLDYLMRFHNLKIENHTGE